MDPQSNLRSSVPKSTCLFVLLVVAVASNSLVEAQIDVPGSQSDSAVGPAAHAVVWPEDASAEESSPHLQTSWLESTGEGISVALLNPANRVRLIVGIDALAVISTERPFPSGTPLFIYPDSAFGHKHNTFDLHARQSHIGALYTGPDLGEFKTGAEILTFLQNDSLTTDDYGLLVYFAYGELKNDDWRFAAGLQQDVFNPAGPTVVYITRLLASGNTGSYRGQVRIERFLQEGDGFGMTLQAALSEPLSTLLTNRSTRIIEDNGLPNLEGRIELGFGPRRELRRSQVRSLEVGVSGVVGQFRTTRTGLVPPVALPPQAVMTAWGVGADIEWRPNKRCGARGEFYIGQAMGEYNGGITQSFNSTTFEEIRSAGGFGEVFYHLTDEVRIHAGYGIDDPRDSDLAPTQIRRNQTYYANCIWDLSKVVQLGLQVDYRMTDYTRFLPNAFRDSEALIVATQFRWKF